MNKAKFSWVTTDEQYHEQRAVGTQSIICYFVKLFFDENVKWLHLEKLREEVTNGLSRL